MDFPPLLRLPSMLPGNGTMRLLCSPSTAQKQGTTCLCPPPLCLRRLISCPKHRHHRICPVHIHRHFLQLPLPLPLLQLQLRWWLLIRQPSHRCCQHRCVCGCSNNVSTAGKSCYRTTNRQSYKHSLMPAFSHGMRVSYRTLLQMGVIWPRQFDILSGDKSVGIFNFSIWILRSLKMLFFKRIHLNDLT